MEADNVDYDTPKNKTIELSNFDRNDVLKSYYQYDKYVLVSSTRAIITRSLYFLNPLFEGRKRFLKELFS